MQYRQAGRVLVFTLILNWLVAAAKLVYGLMTLSASMVADGLHSFTDGTNNIVGLVGLHLASRPVDRTHPYGHEKYETLTAFGIGALLLFVAFEVIRGTVQRIGHPVVPRVNAGSFAVMIVTLAINVFVMIYENREGSRLNSEFLVSDSLHTRSDILVSSSVIVTLIADKLSMPFIDTVVALLIALFIGFSALEIIWQTSRVLSDAAVIDPEKLRKVVMSFKDVHKCHKIRSRGREGCVSVDLHIHVKPSMRTDESHKLGHDIERRIKKEFSGVKEVITHIEPYGPSE